MDRCSGTLRKESGTGAGSSSGSSVDRITALPLELRAQIASLLSFDETVRLTVLSRAWRHIHPHTRAVNINLVALDEDKILAVRVALGRRTLETSWSKVDTLRLDSDFDDHRMRHHAARIIGLADARVIRFRCLNTEPHPRNQSRNNPWSLDLPPAARRLMVAPWNCLTPTIVGPGAAALRKLSLDFGVLGEWLHLPSLVYLYLNRVTVEAPFAPGAWCPLLRELKLDGCEIEQARVDIRLPRLMFLDIDTVNVELGAEDWEPEPPPYGVVTIDAPELIKFKMYCSGVRETTDYKSFTLRAPKLVFFGWRNQYADRMVIDVGRPGSVRFGGITLMSINSRRMKHCREQMMRMLQGLLPNIPPENLDDVAKPYLTLGDWSDSDNDDDEPKLENKKQLTCDLQGLIMSHGI